MPKQQKWKSFPYPSSAFGYEGTILKKHWTRLHQGDCEPFPDQASLKRLANLHPDLKPSISVADAAAKLQEAWRAYHRGDFWEAAGIGLGLGLAGYNVANKAANIYATYLETDKGRSLEIFQEAIGRTEELQAAAPTVPNAWYYYSQALGRYAQGISIAKALAEGLAGKIKRALEQTLKLEPKHADAHIALGAYHANVVNKVGAIAGWITFGASKDEAIRHFMQAIELNPNAAIAKIEFANGLAMLFGKSKLAEATKLYEEAAAIEPGDAMEKLDVELAKSEIES